MDIKSLRKVAECRESKYETTKSGLDIIKADLDRINDSKKLTIISLNLPRITLIAAITAFAIYSVAFCIEVALLMVIAIGGAFLLIEPEIDALAGFSKESLDALKKYRIKRVTSVLDDIVKEIKSL